MSVSCITFELFYFHFLCRHTSKLENFNLMLLKYVPKRVGFQLVSKPFIIMFTYVNNLNQEKKLYFLEMMHSQVEPFCQLSIITLMFFEEQL